jgi:hypothetical protein
VDKKPLLLLTGLSLTLSALTAAALLLLVVSSQKPDLVPDAYLLPGLAAMSILWLGGVALVRKLAGGSLAAVQWLLGSFLGVIVFWSILESWI